MNKVRQKAFIYTVPIYGTEVLFIFYNDIRFANKAFKKNGFIKTTVDHSSRGSQGCEEITNDKNQKDRLYYITIHDTEVKESTLIHELLHLTQDIMESVGIKFRTGAANEPFTYLQEYLFEQFLPYIKNK